MLVEKPFAERMADGISSVEAAEKGWGGSGRRLSIELRHKILTMIGRDGKTLYFATCSERIMLAFPPNIDTLSIFSLNVSL